MLFGGIEPLEARRMITCPSDSSVTAADEVAPVVLAALTDAKPLTEPPADHCTHPFHLCPEGDDENK